MKFEGVKGDVTAEGYTDWIEVNSFQWGLGRGISTPVGGTKDREATAPSVSEVVITKNSDVATTGLMQKALTGDGAKVTFDFCKTDKDKLTKYYEFELQNTLISGFSLNSGGERPTESISLNFTNIMFSNTELTEKNDPGTTSRVSYDMSKGKAGA